MTSVSFSFPFQDTSSTNYKNTNTRRLPYPNMLPSPSHRKNMAPRPRNPSPMTTPPRQLTRSGSASSRSSEPSSTTPTPWPKELCELMACDPEGSRALQGCVGIRSSSAPRAHTQGPNPKARPRVPHGSTAVVSNPNDWTQPMHSST